MKAIRSRLISVLAIAGFMGLLAPSALMAAPINDACHGLQLADPGVTCDSTAANNTFGDIVRRVINILSIVVGAVSVVMIIIGGFRYVVSNGDTNGLQGAKNTILYAIIGLIVVFFAQILVRFVLSTANTPVPPPAPETFRPSAIELAEISMNRL